MSAKPNTDEEALDLASDRANWNTGLLMYIESRLLQDQNFYLEIVEQLGKDMAVELVKQSDREYDHARNEEAARERAEELSLIYPTTTRYGKIVPDVDPGCELRSLDAIDEQEPEWIVPNALPRFQITTLAGDGGDGKTSLTCDIVSGITTGRPCVLTTDLIPKDFSSSPENVLYLSAEDDFSRVLKRKLRTAGADMKRVFTVPISSEVFPKIKFNSNELRSLVASCRPGLVIFDPIQAFVPPDIQMGWRNAMRQCLEPLIGMGETLGASFLIICHTNKQSGLSGRKRIAESADIWDISRSVLMVGDSGENGLKYLSHEKCNYGPLQKTILYKLDGDRVIFQGRSDLKDADYIRKDRLPRSAPARQEATELIIDTLNDNGGQMKADDLDSAVIGQGVSSATLKRAKAELKRKKMIRYWKSGFNDEWNTSLVPLPNDSDQ